MEKIIVAIVIVCVSIVIWLLSKNKTQENSGNYEKSLYNRLGGVFAISAVVDHFSDSLITNPIVGVNSNNKYLREWNVNQSSTRLQGLKFMRTLWLCAVSGGPFVYHPSSNERKGKCPFSLENTHSQLRISPEEFDAVALELSNSLDHFKVPNREKQEVLNAFASHKGEINMGYDISKGLPTKPINC